MREEAVVTISFYAKVEVSTRGDDLTPGLAAATYDPAWLLARQWQLGELRGDDAGTPVAIRHTAEVTSIRRFRSQAAEEWTDVAAGAGPWEAMAEAAPALRATGWTGRLRVDVGRELVHHLRAAGLAPTRVAAVIAAFPFTAPARDASPLTVAAGRVPDGEAAYREWEPGLRQSPAVVAPVDGVVVDGPLRDALRRWLEFCDALLTDPVTDAWQPRRLSHSCAFAAPSPAGTRQFSAPEHAGGPLDWWAFDAEPPGEPEPTAEVLSLDSTVLPTRVEFSGMPAARWWECENADVDFGRVEANPADLARMAVLEFAVCYGNDHFMVPVRLPVGSWCRTTGLLVTDTFGVTTTILPAATSGPDGRARGAARWTLFTISDAAGAPVDGFLLPATGVHQVASAVLEDILLTRDEMANLAWAIERRVEGPDGEPVSRAEQDRQPPVVDPLPADASTPRWVLGTSVSRHWYPLVPDQTGTGDLLVTAMGSASAADEAPQGRLLRLGQRLPSEAVPREGRRLRRDHVLARWADGSTVMWSRRRTDIGRGEGSSGLAFDGVELP